jgi:SAM-dependent methyltransferase
VGDGDAKVRAQYEAYPYPARDPGDEAHRLITGSPSHLLEIEHFVLAGGCSDHLRALVAGGGTGDGAIMLAQQLAYRGNGSVTYLDMSTASLEIAKARADARSLANISFHHGSLLDLPGFDWAPFDYIDCCGVLHHLAAPDEGLAALTSMLSEQGGLGLMLYGELGRTGVYPAQRAIARLLGDGRDDESMRLARRLVDTLPSSNWLKRNEHLSDHLAGDDAGFHDLLLHSRDRAYLVGEIAELITGAGLRITGFLPAAAYDPCQYLDDADLRARAAALPEEARWALAEELSGAMKTHVLYAVRQGNEAGGAATGFAPAMVPVLREMAAERLAASLEKSRRLSAELAGVERQFELPEGAAQIVALIDGRRSLRQIHGRLRAGGAKLSWPDFEAKFAMIFEILHGINLLLFAGAKSA